MLEDPKPKLGVPKSRLGGPKPRIGISESRLGVPKPGLGVLKPRHGRRVETHQSTSILNLQLGSRACLVAWLLNNWSDTCTHIRVAAALRLIGNSKIWNLSLEEVLGRSLDLIGLSGDPLEQVRRSHELLCKCVF